MNRRNQQTTHSIDFVFVILTFFIYAFCMIALIYMGAMVYRNVTNDRSNHDTVRTTAAYLNEKVRQNDTAGAISVASIEDASALKITTTYNETEYATYIYANNGKLCELFMRAENEPNPEAGTEILEIEDISFVQEENGLIAVSLTDNEGIERTFTLYTMSAEEAKNENTSQSSNEGFLEESATENGENTANAENAADTVNAGNTENAATTVNAGNTENAAATVDVGNAEGGADS